MINMIERFIRIIDSVNLALKEFNIESVEEEISTLGNILIVLKPMEIAIKELSKNNANFKQRRAYINIYSKNLRSMKVN